MPICFTNIILTDYLFYFQIKVNPHPHTCPSVNRSQRLRAAKRRWIADASMAWIRKNPAIGTKEIQGRLLEKYGLEVPYSRCYYGKEMALDKIYGKYSDSFQLLYAFKAEVERASPGSVVDIDHHTVEYKLKGKKFYKECFRRVFVYFKAC